MNQVFSLEEIVQMSLIDLFSAVPICTGTLFLQCNVSLNLWTKLKYISGKISSNVFKLKIFYFLNFSLRKADPIS